MKTTPTHLCLTAPLALATTLGAAGCNPLVFEDVVEGSHVREFTLKGTLNAPIHSDIAVAFDTTGDGLDDHLLIANGEDASLGWMQLNEAGFAQGDFPDGDVLNQLFFPIERADQALVGGLAEVPDPVAAMMPGEAAEPYALVSFQSPTDLDRARVVRFRLPGFQRADDVNVDIINVRINDSLLPRFGRQLAAINLDADQSDPDYEVMVGSEQGVLVFDNLGKNRLMYDEARMQAPPGDVSGDNEAEGYGWTYCSNLPEANGMTAGLVGPGATPTFVVGTFEGLTFVAEQEPPVTNLVGAPVYDCAKRQLAPPAEATETFGAELFIEDFNGDGLDDLAVGDPNANLVFIYYQAPGTGIPSTPSETVMPFDDEDGDTLGFGGAIGVAELGPQIGTVFLVGAPQSAVGQTTESGRFFAYSMPTLEPVRAVLDAEPSKNTRWGRWVGGISVGEREEIVIHGNIEGRVHVALNEDDPRP